MNIRICIFACNKFLNGFMRAADVFENFKHLTQVERIDCSWNEKSDLNEVLTQMKQAAEKEATHYIIAAFVVGTDIGYIDRSVKTVSDGEQWCLFANLLRSYGYMGSVEDLL